MKALLVLAVAADTLTFLLLPVGSEANPFVLFLGPIAAITIRWLAVVVLVTLAQWRPAWREGLLLPGIVAGSIGFGANLSVLVS